jgi:alkylation response protein AidB-like acyl-CoA dehydrogenase
MNFGLDEDQGGLLSGLEGLIAGEAPPMPVEPRAYETAEGLERALAESGYLDLAWEPSYGLLGAALVVERLARLPQALECAASALVAPGIGLEPGRRPLALASAPDAPARFLPTASLLVVDGPDEARIFKVDAAAVEPVETLFAYPYGRMSADGLTLIGTAEAAVLRRRWRLALAVEAAGCMAAALAVIVDHVTSRQAFGRPLGAFQAIQHRLAMAAAATEGVKWLAFRAAWSDTDADAALAAGLAQSRIAALTYDLHQFAGAMSLTLEFPLHYWTYRLRALAGELGGTSRQSRAAAALTWTDAA